MNKKDQETLLSFKLEALALIEGAKVKDLLIYDLHLLNVLKQDPDVKKVLQILKERKGAGT